LLLDGEPTRSCITFAVACNGRDVRSIEGLEDDAVTAALRTAFSAEHALQCGYCTPGMLVTARDIVRRLPDADDDRVRLELAGNLCRCTGYNGIVRAIRSVLALRMNIDAPALASIAELAPIEAVIEKPPATVTKPIQPAGNGLHQTLHISVSKDVLWAALQDPILVATCVPGAAVLSIEQNHIIGEMAVSFGPIQGKFVGDADVTYGDFEGSIQGEGQDKISKTRLTANAIFAVTGVDDQHSVLELTVNYSLRGALAQFARAPVVQAFADEIAAMVGQNLQAKLTGSAAPSTPPRMSAVRLAGMVFWRWVKKLLNTKP
jgi:carbon-monoxide dehydrogenase small subunit